MWVWGKFFAIGSRFQFENEMSTIKRFEDLEIWKKSREICQDIHLIQKNTKLKNDFKLYNQINGSSGSVMDNVAEGFERNGNKEFT